MEKNKIQKYIYPKLPSFCDLYVIRFGGSGLANCLFVAARAYILAKKNNAKYIEPTWLNFTPGPYIRKDKDKRHYCRLFNKIGVRGVKKIAVLCFKNNQITKIMGLSSYFADLLDNHTLVKELIDCSVRSSVKDKLSGLNFNNIIGIHVRLGDYVSSRRISIDWYKAIIEQINKHTNYKFKFWLFSDGTQQELSDLISMNCVERKFFGNALADILALSKTRLIIGSNSTFSGWAAFLGQVPVIFPKKHFGQVLIDENFELVLNNFQEKQKITDFLDSIKL